MKEEEVAREALLGLSRFRQAFREEMGRTYAEYLRSLRVEEAKRLLAGTSRPLEKIAQEVGYGTTESFCRAFKKAVGMTPGQYRRRLERPSGSP